MYLSELIKKLQEIHAASFEDKKVFDQMGVGVNDTVVTGDKLYLIPSKE